MPIEIARNDRGHLPSTKPEFNAVFFVDPPCSGISECILTKTAPSPKTPGHKENRPRFSV